MSDPHAEAVQLCNRGVVLAQQGENEQAAHALTCAAELLPDQALIHYNLGKVLRALGRLPDAMRAYERAVELSADADTCNNLGLVLHEMGLVEQAHERFSQAVELCPELAGAWCNLGNVLRDLGDREQADEVYQRALALDGDCVAAHYNRFATLYDQERPQQAIDWLDQLLVRWPDHVLARYQRAAALWVEGASGEDGGDVSRGVMLREEAARLRELGAEHLASSLEFVAKIGSAQLRLFADSRDTLSFALGRAQLAGLVVELGVRFGHSLRLIASHAGQRVYGFDSFEGLPDNWGTRAAGLYTTEGQLPSVPDNAGLVPGLFADTLEPFLAEHPGQLRFANIDCDIYASAYEALCAFAPRIEPGTVLVFDEYLGNPGWEQDEHRALSQWCSECGAKVRYLAFSPFSRQAVIQIVSR